MNVSSNYQTIGDDVLYNNFLCELDKNTLLKFDFIFDNNTDKKCKITMEDKVSGIVDISSYVNSEDIVSVIKTLRLVAVQLKSMENNK